MEFLDFDDFSSVDLELETLKNLYKLCDNNEEKFLKISIKLLFDDVISKQSLKDFYRNLGIDSPFEKEDFFDEDPFDSVIKKKKRIHTGC